MTTSTLNPAEQLACPHGMGSPAFCVDCMEEGRFLPSNTRRVSTAAGVAGFAFEKDCGVQALVNSLGASYSEAAAALRSAGWVPGKGTTREQLTTAVAELGFTARSAGVTSILEAQRASESGRVFIAAAFRGRKGHAWAITGGAHLNGGRWITDFTRAYVLEISA